MVYIKRAVYVGTPKVFYEVDFTENPTRDPEEFSQVFGMSYAGAYYDARRYYFSEWEEDYDSFVEVWDQYWDVLSQVPDRVLLDFPYFLVISFENSSWAYGPFSGEVNLWDAFVYVVNALGRPTPLVDSLFREVQSEGHREWTEKVSYEFISNFKVRVDIIRRIITEMEQRKGIFSKEKLVQKNVNPHVIYLKRDPALAFMFIDYYHTVDRQLVANAEENIQNAMNAEYEEDEEYEE